MPSITPVSRLASSATPRWGVSALLKRGDQIAIEYGRLVIELSDGSFLSESMLAEHGPQIIDEIVVNLDLYAFQYASFSTGEYRDGKSPGVTLQFSRLKTADPLYSVFNANLKYINGPKKGTSLRGKQFRVGKQSAFFKFWALTGLDQPRRLSL